MKSSFIFNKVLELRKVAKYRNPSCLLLQMEKGSFTAKITENERK